MIPRGITLEGVVVSTKPKKTVIIRRDYVKYIPKYERYERRHSKIAAHLPSCMKDKVKEGIRVKIAECRKISKTKNFVVIEVIGDERDRVQSE